ncbi:MAG TPA: CRISPR-associated endonuclease Cas3'', partial [bacterium]|nr:CRISPR-associated endonuclease Cas3'' [bacterium]
MREYYKYWGKAKKPESGKDGDASYHLLVYHCLDVAAVAAVWWDNSVSIQRSFSLNNLIKADKVRAWVLFFIALHDIGKFDLRFQLKSVKVWKTLNPEKTTDYNISYNQIKEYYHGPAGLYWLHHELDYILDRETENEDQQNSMMFLFDDEDEVWDSYHEWVEAVCGHHGHIIKSNHEGEFSLPFNVSELFSKQAKDDRKAFIKSLEALFLLPAGLSLMDEPPLPSNLLAGFCSISDWLGSSNNALNFSYVSEECDLMKYFNERYEKDASEIITTTGLISKPKIYQGVQALLKPEYSPRQLQTKVNLLPLASGLSIVEGPTGSGKTELAIDYAWRLINEGLADSIIFALPSQATANGMLPRLDELSGTLFHDHPN